PIRDIIADLGSYHASLYSFTTWPMRARAARPVSTTALLGGGPSGGSATAAFIAASSKAEARRLSRQRSPQDRRRVAVHVRHHHARARVIFPRFRTGSGEDQSEELNRELRCSNGVEQCRGCFTWRLVSTQQIRSPGPNSVERD